MVFSKTERTSQEFKGSTESDFEYLDRCVRPECEHIRVLIEKWVEDYPEQHRGELISRLRAKSRNSFHSAFFELVLHQLFIRLGYEIEIHPVLATGSTRRPDMLIRSPSGDSFYLEAVLAQEDNTSDQKVDQIVEILNRIDSPNFYLSLHPDHVPEILPSLKGLRKRLEKWLAGLDPDRVLNDYRKRGDDAYPTWRDNFNGLAVEFTAFPKSPSIRGLPGRRPIGIVFSEFRRVTVVQEIRKAIAKKGGIYGRLDRPYVIALNIFALSTHREDVIEALFGTEQYVLNDWPSDLPEDYEPPMVRKPDGAWRIYSGPRYTRVSSILAAHYITPWTVAAYDMTLYHNPWAKFPIEGEITRLPCAVPEDNRMIWVEGTHHREILGLAEGWPEI